MKTKRITFFPVFLGFLFFLNPTFAAVDVLPDFIGCLLIWLGLSKVAIVRSDAREIRSRFLKMALIDAIKNLALLMVLGMGSMADKPTVLLILAFAAAVLEMIYLLPAVRGLFKLFYDFGRAFGCEELYLSEPGVASRTERMRRVFIAFLFFREIVCLLPEFAALTTAVDTFAYSRWSRLYGYIALFRSTAFLLVGIAGIYCFLFLFWYYLHFRRAREMQCGLAEQYVAYRAVRPGLAVERRHAVAFLFLGAGVVMLADFYLDFHNIFPDVAAAALLIVGIWLANVSVKLRVVTSVLTALYGAASVISSRYAYAFTSNGYNADAVKRDEEVATAFRLMWRSSLLDAVLFLAFFISLLFVLRAVVRRFAGYLSHHAETVLEGEDEEVVTDSSEEGKQARFESRRLRALRDEFDSRLINCFMFGFFSAVFSFLFDYVKVLPGGRGLSHLLEFMWVFDFCAAIAFAVAFCSLLVEIYREIQNRFRYDE